MLSGLGQERTAGPGLPMVIRVHDKGRWLVVAATVVSQRCEKPPLVLATLQRDPRRQTTTKRPAQKSSEH
jgi:hypothetical protein